MTRKSIAAVLGSVALCSLASCGLLTTHTLDAPPPEAREADLWWQRTTATLAPDMLGTYVAASEVHLRQGTSATYVDSRAYHTMLGGPSHELRLPCPPPDGVLERMRERLKVCDLTRRDGLLGNVGAEK